MSRRLLIILAAVLVLILAGVYAATPLLALNELRAAAERGDAAALQRTVDFPAVRESLKAQLKPQLAARLRTDPELAGNPFAGVALALAPAVTDAVVEGLVTPQVVAEMVREGDASRLDPEAPAASPRTEAPAPETPPRTRYAYRGLGSFAATLEPETSQAGVTLLLERRGLFGWKLTRIELPPDLLAR